MITLIDCPNCQAFGYFNQKDKISELWPNGHKWMCQKCKGSGKVKGN